MQESPVTGLLLLAGAVYLVLFALGVWASMRGFRVRVGLARMVQLLGFGGPLALQMLWKPIAFPGFIPAILLAPRKGLIVSGVVRQ